MLAAVKEQALTAKAFNVALVTFTFIQSDICRKERQRYIVVVHKYTNLTGFKRSYLQGKWKLHNCYVASVYFFHYLTRSRRSSIKTLK